MRPIIWYAIWSWKYGTWCASGFCYKTLKVRRASFRSNLTSNPILYPRATQDNSHADYKPFTCFPSRRQHWSWQLETIDPAWEKSHTKLIGKRREKGVGSMEECCRVQSWLKKIGVYHEWWIDASAVLYFVIYTVGTTLWVYAQKIHDRN